jgi:TolB-like protein
VFGRSSNTNAPQTGGQTGGHTQGDELLEDAIIRSVNVLLQTLPRGATVAVLSISSNDPDLADFILEEIAFHIVNTRLFTVVDRRSLDAIRAEMDFQYSGDVDDHSAVAIGRMLGASIVITGGVGGTGTQRRLRAKSINVQSAEIIAMASERY